MKMSWTNMLGGSKGLEYEYRVGSVLGTRQAYDMI